MARKVEIRIGLDCARRCILDLGMPLLVSANSMWRNSRKRFCGYKSFIGRDVALDSSGFVAMKLYGGYRWSAAQYASLAKAVQPAWWAQMDFCCEPEIAASPKDVNARITQTINGLRECREAARNENISNPMPVLQGWEPSDYVSGPIFDSLMPSLIGIGSVCRRHLRGKNGLLAVVDAIDRRLPQNVMLHLFGVKGSALKVILQEFSNRSFSADSMSYQLAARWEQWHGRSSGKAETLKNEAMKWWNANQPAEIKQPMFVFDEGI